MDDRTQEISVCMLMLVIVWALITLIDGVITWPFVQMIILVEVGLAGGYYIGTRKRN